MKNTFQTFKWEVSGFAADGQMAQNEFLQEIKPIKKPKIGRMAKHGHFAIPYN